MRKMVLILVPLALTGCQTWGTTWSEVSGSRYTRIDITRSATIVQEIDGRTAVPILGRDRWVRLDPGKRAVTLRALPILASDIRDPGIERVMLDIEPCKRYYLNAQFDSPTAKTWKPVVDYVEPIAGCQVAAMTK